MTDILLPKWIIQLDFELNLYKKRFNNGSYINYMENSLQENDSVIQFLFKQKKLLSELRNFVSLKPELGYNLKYSEEDFKTLTYYIQFTENEIFKQLSKIKTEDKDLLNLINKEVNYQKHNRLKAEETHVKCSNIFTKYQEEVLNATLWDDYICFGISDFLTDEDKRAKLVHEELFHLEDKALNYLKETLTLKSNLAQLKFKKAKDPTLEISAYQNNINTDVIFSLQNAIKNNIETGLSAKDFLFNKLKSTYLKNQKIRNTQTEGAKESLFIDFDTAIQIIKESFKEVSQEMADFVDLMVENEYIEYQERPNKRAGACASCFNTVSNFSVVVMIYKNDLRSVITLAHELGHAYHHYTLMTVEATYKNYPLIFAESASMFAEEIVIDKLIKKYNNSQEIYNIKEQRITKVFDLLIMVPSRFDFEKKMFELIKNNNFSKEKVREAFIENDKFWYGNNEAEKNPCSWMLVRHYFLPNSIYYNYPYYFGYLFNQFLSEERTKENFNENFKNFLKETGKINAIESFQNAFNYDMTSIHFWEQAIKKIADTLKKDLDFLN